MSSEKISCGMKNLFSDEECPATEYFGRSNTKSCAYCGYDIGFGEETAKVNCTEDIIHRRCWSDYAEDNFYELCEVIDEFSEE